MDLNFTFANEAQEKFYWATARNQCFSGGFNNGKTFVGCLKAFTLMSTFSNYRVAICRQVRADLMKTTYQTFKQIYPKEFEQRVNEQEGIVEFKNGSIAYLLHLDKVEKSTLRGLEVNSVLTDQAEETQEETYDVLDARVGRWAGAIVPESLLKIRPDWPTNKFGKPTVPSYHMLLCNPDTQFHYIYRKYHPDSIERRGNYFFVEGEWDPTLGSEEGYSEALKHDAEWVDKFVRGQWGRSDAQIHRLVGSSLLTYSPEFIDKIKRKGNLFKSLDHGDSAPTCCLWWAVLDGNYICFREYYTPNQVISYHRKAIKELSEDETYSGNYADPQIFKKTAQKDGGFWTVADEYMDRSIEGPPLHWLPADNNEFATRNRINELLKEQPGKHPITGEIGNFPRIYFVKRSQEYQNGCFNAIKELQSQRRKLIGYIDGKAYYSDEREDSVADHAYDPTRYMISQHAMGLKTPKRPIKPNTFDYFKMLKARAERLSVMPQVPMV
jgi:hypothetical protein